MNRVSTNFEQHIILDESGNPSLVEDAPVIIGSVPPGVQCPAVGLGYILHERQYLYKPCWVFITVV